jgi:F-type H+-transporting ATPase subunit b
MRVKGFVRIFLLLALLSLLSAIPERAFARAQEHSAEAARSPEDKSVGAEAAKETREAIEEEVEEHETLKHSTAIQYLAKKTGMTVHQAHLVAVSFNFLIIAFLIYWYGRKFIPDALRKRTESIQRALEEARAASQEANRRLAEIEARLSKLDTEIAQMQTSAEKEADAEEARIKKAAEDDIRKVVQAAEQEIALAAKLVRRELMIYTAELAITLARKQIQIDSATDQILVRNFAAKLSLGSGGKDRQ